MNYMLDMVIYMLDIDMMIEQQMYLMDIKEDNNVDIDKIQHHIVLHI